MNLPREEVPKFCATAEEALPQAIVHLVLDGGGKWSKAFKDDGQSLNTFSQMFITKAAFNFKNL